MIYIIVIVVIVILFFLFKWNKKNSSVKQPTYERIDKKETEEKLFPDRTDSTIFFQQVIEKSIKNGDFDTANLNFAKLIESLRQQNISTDNSLSVVLEDTKKQYADFRKRYRLEYPSQFLPPNERPKRKSNNNKFKTLLEEVKLIGHPQFPLLRKEYAITSRMPCIDFSTWAIEQLKIKDYDTLWEFVKTFYNEESDFIENLKKTYNNFFKKDFSKYISIESDGI